MRKIAFIASSLGVGGVERQWYELVRGMDKDKFDITLICLYDLGEIGKRIRELGIKVYFNIFPGKFSLFSLYTLIKIIKAERFDVVFLHDQPLAMFYGIIAAKYLKIKKIIVAFHSTEDFEKEIKFNKYFLNKFMRFVHKIVSIGNKQKNYLIEKKHYPSEKIVIIFNGVNIRNYEVSINRENKKQEFNLPLDCKVIGIIARLCPFKRHDVFLDAAKLILQETPDVIFLIVGDGSERTKIEKQIKRLGLTHNTRVLGERKDIAEINKILDVSVLSSDPAVETLPMAIIESMASSVPVVATDVGSLSDLIINGENGFLVPSSSPELLARAILTIVKDEELANKMAKNTHEIASRYFSLENMVKGYEELFLP